MSVQQNDEGMTPLVPSEPEPDRTPRPSPIMATPSTAERCQDEYANGGDIRKRLGWRS
ncbi:hypothetical protein [Streptomyces europaeiscabiei]|uniref:hypothetical protein n=1 Tax=Streptomyces europaeiscabiei TaxID=146819 RepID=UPI002E18E66B